MDWKSSFLDIFSFAFSEPTVLSFLPPGLSEPLRCQRPQMIIAFWNGYIKKKIQYVFLKKHFCLHRYILFTNILCNIRWEYGYRQVQSGLTCNGGGIKASTLPQTPICGSEGKARRKYPTHVARIIRAQNRVVRVLLIAGMTELNCEIYCCASIAKYLVGLNPKEIPQFTNHRSPI